MSGLMFPFLPESAVVITEFTGSGTSELPAFGSDGTGIGPEILLLPYGGYSRRPYTRKPKKQYTGKGSSALPRFWSGGQGELEFQGHGVSQWIPESAGEGFVAAPPHEDYELLTALLATV